MKDSERLFTVCTIGVLLTPVFDATRFVLAMVHHRPLPFSYELLIRDVCLLIAWLGVAIWRAAAQLWRGLAEAPPSAPPPPAEPRQQPLSGPRVFEMTSEAHAIALLQHLLPNANIGDGAVGVTALLHPSGQVTVTLEPLPPGCKPHATVHWQKAAPASTAGKIDKALN